MGSLLLAVGAVAAARAQTVATLVQAQLAPATSGLRSVSTYLLCFVIASLNAQGAGAADVTVSPLPDLGYVGKAITLRAGSLSDNQELRILVKMEGEDWNWGAPWSKNQSQTIVATRKGWLSVDLQVRTSGQTNLSANRFLGQIYIRDAQSALLMLAQPLNRLRIVEVQSKTSANASLADWRNDIRTLDDIVAYIDRIPADKQLFTPTALSAQGTFALQALQAVSGLWHFGNFEHPQAPGCLMQNERQSRPLARIDVSQLMTSQIACCTDYAMVLGALLTRRAIPNRIVDVNDGAHVFNEAFIDGHWWTLDATTALAFNADWSTVVDNSSKVTVYSFSHAGLLAHSHVYSKEVASLRTVILMAAASGLMYKQAIFDHYTQWPASRMLKTD